MPLRELCHPANLGLDQQWSISCSKNLKQGTCWKLKLKKRLKNWNLFCMKTDRRTPNEIICWKLSQMIQKKSGWTESKNNSNKQRNATVHGYYLVIGNLVGKKNFGKFWWKVTVDLEVLEAETWIRTHNVGSSGLLKGALLHFITISLKDFGYLDITWSWVFGVLTLNILWIYAFGLAFVLRRELSTWLKLVNISSVFHCLTCVVFH